MSGLKLQRCAGASLLPATWCAVLAAALVSLSGCSHTAMTNEAMPAVAADPGYGKLVASRLKTSFKNLSPNDAVEISQPRWVMSNKGWSWLACVRFQDHGHRRTYALFLSGTEVVDERYAVQTDACDAQSYLPFDLETGATGPGVVGGPGPLY
jgi:hypothetical protein